MKRNLIVFFCLMMMLSAGCINDSNADALSLLGRGTIKIGIDDEFAPMGFHDKNGEIIGFDVDLAKEAAKRMNLKVEFVPINWGQKKEELNSGRVDVLWNGCDITKERKEYMIFSKPYMNNRQILVVKRGNTQHIYSVSDLEGKIVGTQAGSNSTDYIEENKKLKDTFEEFKTYLNFKEAFEELDKDLVDVLIVDEFIARYEVTNRSNRFEVIDVTVGPASKIGIGFRKDNVALRDSLQKVFDEMVKDGTANKISEKWFGADVIRFKR